MNEYYNDIINAQNEMMEIYKKEEITDFDKGVISVLERNIEKAKERIKELDEDLPFE